MAEPTSPPMSRPSDDGTDAEAWRLPRGLAATAVAIVAVLVGLGWSLHWWGPLNPKLTWQPTATSVTPGVAFLDVVVDNSSRSPVTIEAVRVEGIPGGPTATVATAGLVPTTGGDGPGWTRDDPARQDLPAVLEAGTTGVLVIRVDRPTCQPGDVAVTAPTTIVIALRSDWGRTYEESVALPTGVPAQACPPTLPPETWSPPDRALAVASIGDAFGIAYDADLPADLRLSRIDEPTGLEATIAGLPEVDLAGVQAVVTEVSFDRPDHAAVAYRLEGPVLLTRVGEAVLIDGTWKVTRSTVCNDLGLIPVSCPPLPR